MKVFSRNQARVAGFVHALHLHSCRCHWAFFFGTRPRLGLMPCQCLHHLLALFLQLHRLKSVDEDLRDTLFKVIVGRVKVPPGVAQDSCQLLVLGSKFLFCLLAQRHLSRVEFRISEHCARRGGTAPEHWTWGQMSCVCGGGEVGCRLQSGVPLLSYF